MKKKTDITKKTAGKVDDVDVAVREAVDAFLDPTDDEDDQELIEADPAVVKEIRTRARKAFAVLRRNGFVTKGNFLCCSTCAMAELHEITATQERDRAVYWHGQDEMSLKEDGECMIRYAHFPPPGVEVSSDITREIGTQVREALEGAGLTIDWDGDPRHAILVTGLANAA